MKQYLYSILWLSVISLALLLPVSAIAQEEQPASGATQARELADKLSNPVANLISMPLQNNIDYGIGSNNGTRYTLNVQPVIPFHLSSNLNLITRYIVPVISQYDITGEGTKQSGLADATVSAFFAPASGKKFIWGVGPALLIPIATNDYLASKKFGVGPTVLALTQTKGWTFGALVNQLWSVAGDSDRPDVNQMFLQPFITHNFQSGAGLGANGEFTFNWRTNTTTAYIHITASALTKLGKLPTQIAIGPRIQVAPGDATSRADFGWRLVLTFLFPK